MSQLTAHIEPLWTANDVAMRCAVRRSTVYEWCRMDYIPHIHLGIGRKKPCLRFYPDAVENWLEAKAKEGRSTRIPVISR